MLGIFISKVRYDILQNSTPTFLRDSPSHGRDRAASAASNIKGCVIKVIHDIKG